MKRGHSNARTEELKRVPNDSQSGDYAMIPICGGATPQTVKELPPLALRQKEWREIGVKMGWLPDAGLLAIAKTAAELSDDAANYLTDEVVLPCDEGNAVAEGLTTLAMNARAAIAKAEGTA